MRRMYRMLGISAMVILPGALVLAKAPAVYARRISAIRRRPVLAAAALALSMAVQPAAAQPAGPPAAPQPPSGAVARAEMIMKAADAASHIDPSKWDWPVSAAPEVRQSIISAGYTAEELRNIFTVLVLQARDRWPNAAAPPPPPPPPPSADARPFGAPGTQPPNPMATANARQGGRGFQGLEVYYGSNGYLQNSLSERTDTITYIIAKKDRVYFAFEFDAKHTGKLFGFQGAGKPIHVRESGAMRFEGGRIADTDFRGDDLALYIQAGGKITFPDVGTKP